MSDELAVSARDITVKYGDFKALDGLDFEAEKGKVIGILGPNGAGKSTFVDVVIGARKAAGGTIRTLGLDPVSQAHALRPQVGIVLQSAGFPTGMKVRDILYGWRHYIPKMTKGDVMQIAKRVDLHYLMNRSLSSLSGGERRRVDIAVALYGNPTLIVLDEPTTGLDPISRENVWKIIRKQCDEGATILLTSHYLDEVEYLSDTINIITRGRITNSGTVSELANSVNAKRACAVIAGESVLERIQRILPSSKANLPDGRLEWFSENPLEDMQRIFDDPEIENWQLHDIEVEKPSLKASYAQLITESEESKQVVTA